MIIANKMAGRVCGEVLGESPAMHWVDILGYRISTDGPEGVTGRALALLDASVKGRYIACANPHSLVVAAHDDQFRAALLHADILTPDGVGIILAGKILRGLPRKRVVGYDLFTRFSGAVARRGPVRYFFLGSSAPVLERISARMAREYPGITVCGTYAPSFAETFSEAENEKMIAEINAARPHVLWVGMTAPKQEKWIYTHRHRLEVPLIGAVGAVFDFYAGTKKRAPRWVQASGLEWLFRFVIEPGRLWSRNLRSAPLFVKMVVLERMSRSRR